MSKFVVFEKTVEAVYQRVDKNSLSSGMQTVVNLGSGLVAGMAAALVSQPADTMLSKINKTKGLPGEGTVSRLIKIAGELGLRGSYSGIGARLFMVGTITAGQFVSLSPPFLPRDKQSHDLLITFSLSRPSTVTSRRLLVPLAVSRSPSKRLVSD